MKMTVFFEVLAFHYFIPVGCNDAYLFHDKYNPLEGNEVMVKIPIFSFSKLTFFSFIDTLPSTYQITRSLSPYEQAAVTPWLKTFPKRVS